MISAIINVLKVGGLLAKLVDLLDKWMLKLRLERERRAVQDAVIAKADADRAAAGGLPDDPRDFRD